MAQLEDIYRELKGWQSGIGAMLGFVGLIVAALWNFHLNRRRDDRLRREEALAVGAALYGELLLLRDQLARTARFVGNRYMAHGIDSRRTPDFDRHFLEQVQMPEPLLYGALASKIGLLRPDLILAITQFHERYRTAKSWLPLLPASPDRPYRYAVSSVLEPATKGVIEIEPALVKLEALLGISPPAVRPDIGKAEDAIEMEGWGQED